MEDSLSHRGEGPPALPLNPIATHPPPSSPTYARGRTQDWTEAAKWYTESLKTPADGDDDQSPQGGISDPTYTILSRLAEMYRTGGHGLGQDCQKSGELYSQAAEEAMVAMKGKVANRFYVLAEEAWAEIPEEDEGDGD